EDRRRALVLVDGREVDVEVAASRVVLRPGLVLGVGLVEPHRNLFAQVLLEAHRPSTVPEPAPLSSAGRGVVRRAALPSRGAGRQGAPARPARRYLASGSGLVAPDGAGAGLSPVPAASPAFAGR